MPYSLALLSKAFIAVRKAEYRFMKDMTLEQEVKLLLITVTDVTSAYKN